MKKIFYCRIYAFVTILMFLFSSCSNESKYKILLVTGQSNSAHNWEASHKGLKKILENTEIFQLDLAISPEKGADMSGFRPNFNSYDAVVLDYDGDSWSKETQKNFEQYVSNGGGVVVVHAANNSFPEWKEYNLMTGLGGWGNRDEKSGPYLRWENGKVIKDNSPGPGGMHGNQIQLVVETRDPLHPIMKGLPLRSMHTMDELYGKLRGPAENVNVLATGWSAPKTNGSGNHEPVLFTIKYGKGRIFHNVLGHVGSDANMIAYKSALFIYSIQRGTEWVASGEVMQKIPEDLPNIATPLILPNYKKYTLDDLFTKAKNYEVGKSKKFLNLISQRIRNQNGNQELLSKYEDEIIKLLGSSAVSSDAKNHFCRELSWMGSEKSVPVLKNLTRNKKTAEMSHFALTRLNQ